MKSIEEQREFAKGEETRDIRKGRAADSPCLVDNFECGKREDNDRRIEETSPPFIGDVGSCDRLDRVGEPVFENDIRCETFLKGHRLRWSQLPQMTIGEVPPPPSSPR